MKYAKLSPNGYTEITEAEYADLREAISARPNDAPEGYDYCVLDGTVCRVQDDSERGYHIEADYELYALLEPPEEEPEISPLLALNEIIGGNV